MVYHEQNPTRSFVGCLPRVEASETEIIPASGVAACDTTVCLVEIALHLISTFSCLLSIYEEPSQTSSMGLKVLLAGYNALLHYDAILSFYNGYLEDWLRSF